MESVEIVRPDGVPEGSVLSVFRVPPEVAGQRLDVFLQSQLKRTSRTRTQYIVKVSAYDVRGQTLALQPSRADAKSMSSSGAPPGTRSRCRPMCPILFEDEHILAVDKPALLPVHPTARYHKNTLINVLKALRPGQFLSLGHRIDRETSGVLLVAKSTARDRALKKVIESRRHREDVHRDDVGLAGSRPREGHRRHGVSRPPPTARARFDSSARSSSIPRARIA